MQKERREDEHTTERTTETTRTTTDKPTGETEEGTGGRVTGPDTTRETEKSRRR